MSWDRAWSLWLEFEGTTMPPRGSSGETYCGIDRKAHPDAPFWPRFDELKQQDGSFVRRRTIHPDLAGPVEEYARSLLWSPAMEALPPDVALMVFDHNGHVGRNAGTRCLQKIIGAKVDGVIGRETRMASNRYCVEHGTVTLVLEQMHQRMLPQFNSWKRQMSIGKDKNLWAMTGFCNRWMRLLKEVLA